MMGREQELLAAAKHVLDHGTCARGNGCCICDPLWQRLDRAVAAYDTTPQQEHEAMLATRRSEDSPLPSAGHMNLANVGVDER